MNPIAVIMSVFAVVGALDRIFGNKFGLGREFERGLSTLSSMALSMIGMIVLAPYIAEVLDPFFSFVGKHLPIDPSLSSFLVNQAQKVSVKTEIECEDCVEMAHEWLMSSLFLEGWSYPLFLTTKIL